MQLGCVIIEYMKNLKQILTKLKTDGYRITTIRESILDLFINKNKPLSSLDIQKALPKKNIHANKTTIYRQLDFLKEQELISEMQFDDKVKRYEIISNVHHHHLICVNCRKIQSVELEKDLDKQEKIIEKNKKFKIINHSLEFYGLCQKCRTN
jgi:Fur family ferric uptake transcriptional regulator